MIRFGKLGYVALNVSDLARSAEFYRDHAGLADAGEGPSGVRFFRCSSAHHEIALYPGKPGLKRVGFEMESAEEVERLHGILSKNGFSVAYTPDEERAAQHIGRAIRFSEPTTGACFEFYDGMREVAAPFVPTVAKIERLGHIVLKSPEYEKAVRLFTETLNFQVSDVIDGMVTFLRCYPNPLHHSLALASSKRPGLHHVNFMVTEVDDIGRAMWRFKKAGIHVVHGPGRHPPSGSMFFYFLDPDGITLEYSFGMEEFPAEGARRPRVLEPVQASFDYWGAVPDQRKASVGDIERQETGAAS
jgi:2,3-dihydroxy-p-cumate/2,3-dihydroxybenzoate 3,4-dioxygenase